MRGAKKRSFQDSIQNTLFFYALVPMLIVALAVYIAIMAVLYNTVWKQSERYNQSLAQRVQHAIHNAEEGAKKLEAEGELARELRRGKIGTAMYEALYGIINSGEIRGDFYLLDQNFQPFSGSSRVMPEYFSKRFARSERLKEKLTAQGTLCTEWETYGRFGEPSYAVGTPLFDAQGLAGYLVIDFSQKQFLEVADRPISMQVMLTSSMGHVYWDTGAEMKDGQGKLLPQIKHAEKLLAMKPKYFLVDSSSLRGGTVLIYTIQDVSNIYFTLQVAGVVILGVFGGMLLLNRRVSGMVARNKTEIIDQISKTMEQACKNRKWSPMVINSGDEFEQIAASYNSLCEEIGRLMEDNRESARLQMLAEVRRLESQFNPHFIFNTLETIKVLVRTDPPSAQNAIVRLSELLRYSIDDTFENVTLAEDLHYTECYLYIQKLRFQERLEYKVIWCENTKQLRIPRMIIQPLVENATNYGADETGKCTITIRIRKSGQDIVIDVVDQGENMTGQKLEELRALLGQAQNTSPHMGIYNVHKRLQLFYGKGYGLTISRGKEKGTDFQVRIPWKGVEAPDVQGTDRRG